jgi:putative MATE family efflux protein
MDREYGDERFVKKREIEGMFAGPVLGLLGRIALPIFLGMLFQLLYAIVDIIWISRIDLSDPSYVGGVGLIFPLLFLAVAISSGILIGVASLVARSIGEGDGSVLDRVAESGFLVSLLIASTIITLGYSFDRKLMTVLGAQDEYFRHALDYFRYVIPVAGLMIVGNVLLGILLGEGCTTKVMIAMIITTIANVILDPLFIFSLGMGVKGAGIATVISQLIAAVYLLRIFLRGHTRVKIGFNLKYADFRIIRRIVAVGFPQTAGQIAMGISVLVFNRIVVSVDRLALTAFALCTRFDQVLIIPVMAIGSSLITVIGQNYGRGNIHRVRDIWRTGVLVAMGVSAACAAGLIIFAPRIYPFFTDVRDVVHYAVLQTRLVEVSFVFASVAVVGRASFQAINRPLNGFTVAAFRLALVSIPVAYALVRWFGLGMYAVWIGLISGNSVSAVIGFFWVRGALNRCVREAPSAERENRR